MKNEGFRKAKMAVDNTQISSGINASIPVYNDKGFCHHELESLLFIDNDASSLVCSILPWKNIVLVRQEFHSRRMSRTPSLSMPSFLLCICAKQLLPEDVMCTLSNSRSSPGVAEHFWNVYVPTVDMGLRRYLASRVFLALWRLARRPMSVLTQYI